MEMAATDYARYKKLLEQDAVPRQQYDAARTDYEAKKARYEMLARQRSATSLVVAETRQRIAQNDAGIELAKALLETAELNLSYCYILAPCDGYTSRKEIQVGQLVQPGQTLLDVVDSADVWVTANSQGDTVAPHNRGQRCGNQGRRHPRRDFQRQSGVSLKSYRRFALASSAGQFGRQLRQSASACAGENRIFER